MRGVCGQNKTEKRKEREEFKRNKARESKITYLVLYIRKACMGKTKKNAKERKNFKNEKKKGKEKKRKQRKEKHAAQITHTKGVKTTRKKKGRDTDNKGSKCKTHGYIKKIVHIHAHTK